MHGGNPARSEHVGRHSGTIGGCPWRFISTASRLSPGSPCSSPAAPGPRSLQRTGNRHARSSGGRWCASGSARPSTGRGGATRRRKPRNLTAEESRQGRGTSQPGSLLYQRPAAGTARRRSCCTASMTTWTRRERGVTINRRPRDGRMAFVGSPDGISIELLPAGGALPVEEPRASMPNEGGWQRAGGGAAAPAIGKSLESTTWACRAPGWRSPAARRLRAPRSLLACVVVSAPVGDRPGRAGAARTAGQ